MPNLSAVQVAELFAKLCSKETLAGILSGFLSCEDEDGLTDDEINYGNQLFDSLEEICDDDILDLAQGR